MYYRHELYVPKSVLFTSYFLDIHHVGCLYCANSVFTLNTNSNLTQIPAGISGCHLVAMVCPTTVRLPWHYRKWDKYWATNNEHCVKHC